MFKINSTRFVAFSLTVFFLPFSSIALSQPNDYSSTDAKTAAPIANPERGFYKHEEITFGSGFTPLNPATLEKLYTDGDDSSNKKISLIFRLYYIGEFRKKPLSPAALQLIKNDLTTLRRAGMKAILRFAYTANYVDPPKGNAKDAHPDRAFEHIKQLREIFEQYKDVIAVVQTGFVGSWGEWYSAHKAYGRPFDTSQPLNKERRRVISALLDSVTKDRAIQLRSYFYKDKFGITDTNPDFYRIGFHNDALGGPLSTQGMSVPSIDCFTTPDNNFCVQLSKQTLSVPMGGEAGDASYITNENNPTEPNENLKWNVVAKEFARNHWSFLNPRRYQKDTVNPTIVEATWQGHFVELNNRLGYRFVLVSSDFQKSVTKGNDFAVTVTLRNDGWASPFNQRTLELVLRPASCKEYVCPEELSASTLNGDTDPRKWFPIDHSLGDLPNSKQPKYTFSGIFKNSPAGTYTLSLRLADPVVDDFFIKNVAECKKDAAKCLYDLRTVGRFSIRMANEQEKGFKWDEAAGLNQLGTVTVVN